MARLGSGLHNPRMRKLLTFLFALVTTLASAQDLPARFDPNRDAAADVATALAMAKAQNKRVIVDVGGEWCIWCHILDRHIAAHPEQKQLRDRHFVWLKLNVSKENKNEAVLSRWPKVKGYPHLFVLDADGKLLHSQNTGDLESGKDYDPVKMVAFFKQYAR